MMRLRAITWALGIWATAVSTLLAGIPHLQCLCPDGRTKPFCLSILIPSTCCGNSCCAAADASEAERGDQQAAKKTCCCCQPSHRTENGPSERVRPMGCQKSFVKAAIAVRSDIVRDSANVFVSPLSDGLSTIPFWTPQPDFGRFTLSPHWSPPSSNLVIALARLLI